MKKPIQWLLQTTNCKLRTTEGVTFIELLIVIAIVGIIGASITPFLSNFILKNNFQTTTDKVISALRKAQMYSMTGKNNVSWGVCISASEIKLYTGSCVTPTFQENFSISPGVSISPTFNITFSTRGEPTSIVSSTISTSQNSSVVTVNAAGMIDIN